ncbi:hypothetical protein HY024_04065 [Candidatus Curtissbacteria bacterium]|nr:hypothetical protein [Candidatus Curtissbacteria bacterium]
MLAEAEPDLGFSKPLQCHDLGMPLDHEQEMTFEDVFGSISVEKGKSTLRRIILFTAMVGMWMGCPGDEIIASVNGLLPHLDDTTQTSPQDSAQLVALFWASDPDESSKIRIVKEKNDSDSA